MFFLHYAAQSDFEQGIFTPFNTQDEAMMQAASDLNGGCHPDIIEQIFEAPYELPRFGWTRSQLDAVTRGDLKIPHLIEGERKKVATRKQIVAAFPKLADRMAADAAKGQSDYILERHEELKAGRAIKGAVPGNAYTWCTGGTATGGACALAAATAKTAILIVSGSANQPAMIQFIVSFDGVTASAVPVLVELISGTAAGAGTPRAALASGKQIRGWPAQTSQTTFADTYTAEPTVQLVDTKLLLTPNGGLFPIQYPLGREPTGIVTAATDAKTLGIRLTAPAIVNAHVNVEIEE